MVKAALNLKSLSDLRRSLYPRCMNQGLMTHSQETRPPISPVLMTKQYRLLKGAVQASSRCYSSRRRKRLGFSIRQTWWSTPITPPLGKLLSKASFLETRHADEVKCGSSGYKNGIRQGSVQTHGWHYHPVTPSGVFGRTIDGFRWLARGDSFFAQGCPWALSWLE